MSLNRRLQGHAIFQPERIAIEYESESISYRALNARVETRVATLQARGLERGERVAILALNHPEWFVLLFALARLGLVMVPLNGRVAEAELVFMLQDCAPSLLLHDAAFAAVAGKLADTVDGLLTDALVAENSSSVITDSPAALPPLAGTVGTDPLLIVYTSGTTGRPKGAVLSEQALLCSAAMSQHMLDLSPADRVLNVLPLFHVGGLNIQPLPALLYGARLLLHARFDAAATVAALQHDRVTLINTVPTILQALLQNSAWSATAVSALRAVSIGSTDVPVELIERVHALGIPLIQVYGATETGPVAIYQRIEHSACVGSIGRAGLLCDIRLINDAGQDVEVGQSGEILVRGQNLLSHYWNQPGESGHSLVDGWFRTGDVAHRDEQGNYWFDDRVTHVVISGGENIYPAELERLIRVVPGVVEVAVVGRPDEKWGEVPVAAVVAAAGVLAADIDGACHALARFKRPRQVVFVPALPRNALGKIQVQQVRAMVTAG